MVKLQASGDLLQQLRDSPEMVELVDERGHRLGTVHPEPSETTISEMLDRLQLPSQGVTTDDLVMQLEGRPQR